MKVKNEISETIGQVKKEEVMELKQKIEVLLPFLISVNVAEQKNKQKIGDKDRGFLEKIIDYCNQNPALIPTYMDNAEMQKDFNFYRDLIEITRAFAILQTKMEDTAMLAGTEALAAANVFYNAVKTAAKQGVSGAEDIYNDLKKRYPGGGKAKNDSTQTS